MRLIICGNGFDLHHKLRTSYFYYSKFLRENYFEVYDYYNDFKYLKLEVNADNPWVNIEESLNIYYDDLMDEAVTEWYPDLSSDTDSRWDEMRINVGVMTEFIKKFTGKCFYEWISQIDTSKVNADLDLSVDDIYITFNYTNTLETLYDISRENILYIHGNLKNISLPVTDESIRKEIQFGATELNREGVIEKIENLYGEDEFYGASISLAVKELESFFKYSTKQLKSNYEKLRKFIANNDIEQIVIMGHNLCKADYLYYKDIIIPLFHNIEWKFYKHDNETDINEFISLTKIKKYQIEEW